MTAQLYILLTCLLASSLAMTWEVAPINLDRWAPASYPNLTISLGDSLLFMYDALSDVSLVNTLDEFNNCNISNATILGVRTDGLGQGFTYTPEVSGTFFIISTGGLNESHCLGGEKFVLTVEMNSSMSHINTTHIVSMNPVWADVGPYPDITNATVNDSLIFNYTTGFNVVLFKNRIDWLNCDEDGNMTVIGNNDAGTSGFVYNLTKATTYYFACMTENGTHCRNGMKFFVEASENITGLPPTNGTEAPAPSGTQIPAPSNGTELPPTNGTEAPAPSGSEVPAPEGTLFPPPNGTLTPEPNGTNPNGPGEEPTGPEHNVSDSPMIVNSAILLIVSFLTTYYCL